MLSNANRAVLFALCCVFQSPNLTQYGPTTPGMHDLVACFEERHVFVPLKQDDLYSNPVFSSSVSCLAHHNS